MNADDILDMIGDAKGKYIWDAQIVRSGDAGQKVVSVKRFWLIAAVIALALLLVGCAAVFLWMQERSIGQKTYTQRFDAQGHYIEPTEKTLDTVTLFGSGGSDMQKALAEWIEFNRNYPDFFELGLTDEDAEKVPERYRYTYNCYTFEMVDALEEIAGKYNLKLLDTEISFQRYQYESVLEGLGLTSLLRADAAAVMENGQGDIKLPQNFNLEFFMDMTGLDAPWAKEIYVNYSYAQAGYFPGFGTATIDLTEYQQWKYTSSDGTPLLLALNQKGEGIILAERQDSMIYLDVDSNFAGPNFPEPETVIDRAGLERLADAFDYSIQPQAVDVAALQLKLDADQKTYNERMQEAVTTYAGFTEFLLENAHFIPTRHYAFYDLDGDGTEEMILGGPGVEYTRILHENQGEVREHGWFCDFRVLENGGFLTMQHESFEEESSLHYGFYPPMESGYPMTFDYGGNGPELRHEEWEQSLLYRDGIWKNYTSRLDTGTVIPEEEAQAIINQYPKKELDWQPVWDYPIDTSGRTIGDELSSRKLPQTEAEYIQFYADAAETGHMWLRDSHTHFALRDMNADGILDILLSSDGVSADWVFTWKYGRAVSMGSYFSYLCEGNVMCSDYITSADDGADLQHYIYTRFNDRETETLADMVQNKASGVWTDNLTGQTITQAEADAILTRYPKITLQMRPIGELAGQ